ncbi:FlaD/FlaE family flagellar protein [Methanocaldococcus sp.]
MIQKTINETSLEFLPDEEVLTDDEIEEYLENLKSKLPSFVIILLKNNLKGRRITKRQLDKIVERITEVLSKSRTGREEIEEVNKKLQSLEQKLDTIMKLTTVVASSKISEEIEKAEKEEDKEVKVEEEIEIKPEEIKIGEESEEIIKKKDKKIEEEVEEKPEEKTSHVEIEPIEVDKTDKVVEEKKSLEEKIKEEEEIPKALPEIGEIEEVEEMIEGEQQFRLNDIPEDPISTALAFKWLQFLVSKVGLSNLPDVLDYYHKIGWISNKVVLKLLRYSKNMRFFGIEENVKVKDKLTPSDHIMSLLYIEKLAGRPLDPDILEMLEIEIRRIKKWAEELRSI